MFVAAPYDARVVANHLLALGADGGAPMTQLSLLKLIYFGHGWYLAHFDRPLVRDYFEAWKYGPVLRSVREAFSEFGDRPINRFATKFDYSRGESVNLPCALEVADSEFLRDILYSYGKNSAWQLSELTHEPGSPWDVVWNGSDGKANVGLVIPNELIARHFESLYGRFGRM
jgi:uncharacterized phage-associated protein